MLTCPECNRKRMEFCNNEWNWLWLHTWNWHRDPLEGVVTTDCPWCFENVCSLYLSANDVNLRRGQHLAKCIAYLATCLSGVRQQ